MPGFPRPSVTFTALLTANDDQKTGVEIVRKALSYHRGDVCQDNRSQLVAMAIYGNTHPASGGLKKSSPIIGVVATTSAPLGPSGFHKLAGVTIQRNHRIATNCSTLLGAEVGEIGVWLLQDDLDRRVAMGRVNMASALTDRGFLGRLVRISLALVILSACSQQPAEQESDISGARKTSEPAQEQRADAGVDCRDEVVAAFERLKTSGRPYRKEMTVTVGRRTYNETVEFAPPDQMRLSDNSRWLMNAYYIRIGQRAWANWSPFPWGWSEDYPDPGSCR